MEHYLNGRKQVCVVKVVQKVVATTTASTVASTTMHAAMDRTKSSYGQLETAGCARIRDHPRAGEEHEQLYDERARQQGRRGLERSACR